MSASSKHDEAVSRVLVIGYGNPAREDDGLGPAAAERIKEHALDGVDVDTDYQLTVEDAAAIAEYDVVLFVDASVEESNEADAPYYVFREVEAVHKEQFSSHAETADTVMGLARDMFGADTKSYVLGIRGTSFAMFVEEMTEEAQRNLDAAIEFIIPCIRNRAFESACKNESNVNA